MIQIATSIRRRNQPSKFRLLKQSSLLKYPALEDEQDVLAAQLHFLSTNLSFDAYAICKHCSDKHNSRVFIHMDVFSLGPLFGPYVPGLRKDDEAKKPAGTENSLIPKFSISHCILYSMKDLPYLQSSNIDICHLYSWKVYMIH